VFRLIPYDLMCLCFLTVAGSEPIPNAQAPVPLADAGAVIKDSPPSGKVTTLTDAGVDAGWVQDAGLTIELSGLSTDGGQVSYDLDGGVAIDQKWVVHVTTRLQGFRIRVLDSSDRQMEFTEDLVEQHDIVATLSLSSPPPPGSLFSILVEPDSSEPMRDARGAPVPSGSLRFRTAGTAAPRVKPKRSKHHRR
jgi:hypothetical protein